MARGSHHPSARNWARARAAIGALFFCTGVITLPPLIVADLSVWLGCHNLNKQACVQLLTDSMLLSSMAELGVTVEVLSSPARAQRRR